MVISQADLDLHYFICPQVCPRMPLRSIYLYLCALYSTPIHHLNPLAKGLPYSC